MNNDWLNDYRAECNECGTKTTFRNLKIVGKKCLCPKCADLCTDGERHKLRVIPGATYTSNYLFECQKCGNRR